MFNLENVSIKDWLVLAIGFIGLFAAQLESRNRLPGWARRWFARIGNDRIEQAIEYAAKIEGLSPEARRKEAVDYLVRLSERELGFHIPTSVANLLIEYVYQQWKRR